MARNDNPVLSGVGLLLRDVANKRKLKLLPLIRFQHQDNPDHELAEPEQRHRDKVDDGDQAQDNIHHDARQEVEQRLEAVEAESLVLAVGLDRRKISPTIGM